MARSQDVVSTVITMCCGFAGFKLSCALAGHAVFSGGISTQLAALGVDSSGRVLYSSARQRSLVW